MIHHLMTQTYESFCIQAEDFWEAYVIDVEKVWRIVRHGPEKLDELRTRYPTQFCLHNLRVINSSAVAPGRLGRCEPRC